MGVMATGSGDLVQKKSGKHFKGEEKSGQRPVADLEKKFDPASYVITIFELQQGRIDFGTDLSILTNEFLQMGVSRSAAAAAVAALREACAAIAAAIAAPPPSSSPRNGHVVQPW